MVLVVCTDQRPCWARKNKRKRNGQTIGDCDVLNDGYPDGKCPFAKAKKEDVSYTTMKLRELRKGGGSIG